LNDLNDDHDYISHRAFDKYLLDHYLFCSENVRDYQNYLLSLLLSGYENIFLNEYVRAYVLYHHYLSLF
jgi:hypothetical protein